MKYSMMLLLWVATVSTLFSQETRVVKFAWGTEQLPANFNLVKQQKRVPSEELIQGKFVRFVLFDKTLTTGERAEMAGLCVEILGYVFPSTYLLLLPASVEWQRLEKYAPYSVVAIQPTWKMAKSLREPPFGQWAVQGDWIDINIKVYAAVEIPIAAAACRENGMIVRKEGTQNGFLQVRVLKTALQDVAALPFVQMLELVPAPGEQEDIRGRSLHRSNTLDTDHPWGKKYNGEGVKTLVRDDGQLGPHIDFQGRLFNQTQTTATLGTHGDGVGGIIAGAGNLDPTKKGMAAGADVFVLDYINDFQDQTLSLHLSKDVTITNSSYSDGCNIGYTLATQTVDQQLYEHPTLMHVFSAGNSNGSNCNYGAGTQWGNITGGHKMAKNAIATANLLPDATLDATSSRGPAYDGRLKPDISANGTNHFSTNPNNAYQEFGGTSAAAPGIAGCLAQLTHGYKDLHGGQEPNATLLKATLLNTANDLGNIGPDFKFGWGHVNAWRAWLLLEQNRYLSAQVDHAATTVHALQVPDGVRQAKMMIVWADPPADPAAPRALTNDLDIRLVSPDGAVVYLPWKLDPTPNATALGTPATKGRDSLNNVEQVTIDAPLSGDYTVYVQGKDVPFGPQAYYLVWEFIADDIKLTYPAGGEGFVPGAVERIHWDAYGTAGDFNLQYSTDAGATFNPLASLAGTKRMYDWTVPNTVSGRVLLALDRGGYRDTTDFPFSIAPVPQGLKIVKVCPDTITVQWDSIAEALSYDVYILGGKYMELVGSVDTNQYQFPITNAGEERWVSVRSKYDDGALSRRAIAVNWPGGLKNCPQENDLGVRTLLDPVGGAIVSCSATTQNITVRLVNEGLAVVTGAQLSYQVDSLAVFSENIPAIPAGDTLEFTFQNPIALAGNGAILLKVWATFPGDITYFNDTLTALLPFVTQAVSGAFEEHFESDPLLPLGWTIRNPDDGITWSLTNAYPGMIGLDGNPTRAYFMSHYQYEQLDALDYLYMVPVDFGQIAHPALEFDLAHRPYGTGYTDGLRVELFPQCDLAAEPIVVYEKFDPALGTNSTSTTFFVPSNSNDWKRQTVDLGAFAGQTAVIRFVGINGYGNNTFLDNIGVAEYVPPVLPVAEYLAVEDTICRQDTTIVSASQLTPNAQYAWTFGTASFPTTAVGPGPHAVYYPTPGTKNIRLIASNAAGTDTAFHALFVRQFPTANFTQNIDSLTITLTNASSNAAVYRWDFGDGNTSTLPNPTHTYNTPGIYSVKLDAINPCKTVSKTVIVAMTTKVQDLTTDGYSVLLQPNPTEGDFMVTIDSPFAESIRLSLFDARGAVVTTLNTTVKQGATAIPFRGLQLSKGIYQLTLEAASGWKTFRIAVQ
jgi:PKD repeat protein